MKKLEIQVNQVVRVSRNEGEDDWFISSIQDIDSNSFCISMPTQGSHSLMLKEGESVRFYLASESSRFEFVTRVLGKRLDNIPLYIMAYPEEYVRKQLREFFRIPFVLDVYYRELLDNDTKDDLERCTSLDISGGGMKLLFKKEYPINTRMFLKFTIPFKDAPKQIEAIAAVVRTVPVAELNQCHVCVKFISINNKLQDLVVRFILNKMSEQNRLK